MHYTRVALVQLPEDLVAYYLPEAASKLILHGTNHPSNEGRSSELLVNILDSLRRDIYELAKAQAELCIREILRFAGHWKVDVVVFPDLALQPGWVELLELEQRYSEVSAIAVGPLILPRPEDAQTLQPLGERMICLPTHRVVIRTFHAEERIEVSGGTGHVLSVVSVGSRHRTGSELSTRLDRLQIDDGVATAMADSKGYSRFYARVWKGSTRSRISDKRPLGAPLYRMPPGNSGINILDIELTHQRGKWLDAGGFHTRSVTVAPIIQRDFFPEYARMLQRFRCERSKSWRLRALEQREVRLRTLNRIQSLPGRDLRLFRQKLIELDSSYSQEDGLTELQRFAVPGNLERLVDAIPVGEPLGLPLAESVHRALGGVLSFAIRNEVGSEGLARACRDLRFHYRSVLARTLSDDLSCITVTEQSSGTASQVVRSRRDVDEFLSFSRLLLRARSRTESHQSRKRRSLRVLERLSTYIEEYSIVHNPVKSTSSQEIDYSEIFTGALARKLNSLLSTQGLFGDVSKLLGKAAGFPKSKEDISAEISRWILLARWRSFGNLNLSKTPRCKGNFQIRSIERVIRELENLRSLNPIGWLWRSEGLTLSERELVRLRLLAMYLMLAKDPSVIKLGFRHSGDIKLLVLSMKRTERLQILQRLGQEERLQKSVSSSAAHLELDKRLGRLLGDLLDDPVQHWNLVPEILSCQDQFLEVDDEIRLLSILGVRVAEDSKFDSGQDG